jgi:hypothetical protein
MTSAQLLAVALGLGLAAVGVGVYLLAYRSERLGALLDLPITLRNVWRLMLPADSESRLVDSGSVMTCKLSVPCVSGWYWVHGQPVQGTLLRVTVPLGFVARLPDVDLTSGRQFVDASTFVLVRNLAITDPSGGDEEKVRKSRTLVTLLQRSCRWQVLIRGDQHKDVKAMQDVSIRAHVAVHTSINVDMTDARAADAAMSRVFTDFKNYRELVEKHVLVTLTEFASVRAYSEIVTNPHQILDRLNESWVATAKRGVADQKRLGSVAEGLITTRFTGVVVKPLLEQEEARLRKVLSDRVYEPKARLEDMKTDFERWQLALQSMVINRYETLESHVKQFESFPNQVDEWTKSDAKSMSQVRTGPELIEASREPGDRVRKSLMVHCDSIVEQAARLRDAIIEIRRERERQIEEGGR